MKKTLLLLCAVWISPFLFARFSEAASTIRVELTHAPKLAIDCPQEFNVTLPSGQPIYLGKFVQFRSEPGGISMNGRLFKTEALLIHPNAPFSLNKHHFRGQLVLRKEVGMLEAINLVDLEKYLSSVVGSEVSSRWPREALKAQAVVARTYALEKMKEHQSLPFDVVATVQDQAYEGIEGESAATEDAVHATRGQVLLYQGEVITAYYHADCGGRTEEGKNVFSGDLPYLQSVVCPYGHDSPYQHWSKSYSMLEMSERLGKGIQNVAITKNSATGRVATVTLETTQGHETLAGFVFRKFLGTRDLRSTQFDMTVTDQTVYVPREEILPRRTITEYMSKQLLKLKHEAVTEPISLGDKVVLMHRTGALVEVDVSSANPLVAISGGGFLYTVFRDLAARTLKTETVSETVSVPYLTLEAPRKKVVWVPLKVPAAVHFTGKGWGHGVGLCQWGSRGMALLGKSYQESLHYYYQDVELKTIYQ